MLQIVKGGEKLKRKHLIKFRIDLGLKSKDMAEKLGVSRVHYSNIENGKVDPSFKFVEKFGNIFKGQYDDFWELFKKIE